MFLHQQDNIIIVITYLLTYLLQLSFYLVAVVFTGIQIKQIGINYTQTIYYYYFFSLALQPSAGYGLLVHEVFLITHNGAPQSLGLLWMSDQLIAETPT
jgi:hypothetical protein